MADDVSWLHFSCVHCPMQDEQAVDWLIEQIAAYQPDVLVHGGDGHEADSASRWPSEHPWTLADEFASHNAFLARLRKAAPKARRILLEGNHEDNLQSINRIDKKLRDLCDYRDHEPEIEGWEIIPYVFDRKRGCFRLGEVVFAHGYEANQSADEMQALYFANEYGLYVGGHTHRPTPEGAPQRCLKTKGRPLRYWYANSGCMRGMKPDYMLRKRTETWGQAITRGRSQLLKSPRRAKTWDAETIHYRMYDDDVT